MPISIAARVDLNESMLNLPPKTMKMMMSLWVRTSIEMNTQARTLVITGLNIL